MSYYQHGCPPEYVIEQDFKSLSDYRGNAAIAIPLQPFTFFTKEEVAEIEAMLKDTKSPVTRKPYLFSGYIFQTEELTPPLCNTGKARALEGILTTGTPFIMSTVLGIWPPPLERTGKLSQTVWSMTLPDEALASDLDKILRGFKAPFSIITRE